MSIERIYGIVLWRDAADGSAVIWCDDHAELAFLDGASEGGSCKRTGVALASGDLILFALHEEGDVRRACAAELVNRDGMPRLAEMLKLEAAALTHGVEPAGGLAQPGAAGRPRLV